MKVTKMLDNEHVQYKVCLHTPAYTAQQMAQKEHVSGDNVAKPVIVNADGQDYMCVLPACCLIDFDALKSILQAQSIVLIDESRLKTIFPDCQIGAEPPFGSFYGMPTIMDDRLEKDEFIVFQSRSHEKAIRMDMDSYLKIEQPRIASFSYHV